MEKIDRDKRAYTNYISIIVEINRVELSALLNSEAENNFILQKIVVELGVKGEAPNMFSKAVDSR